VRLFTAGVEFVPRVLAEVEQYVIAAGGYGFRLSFQCSIARLDAEG
jgi:hypothetical protein